VVFSHSDLRIQFEVPPNFVLFNSPNQVIAIGPNKSRIIFDMANPEYIRQSGSLRKYLLTHWGSNLDLQNIERVDVNGMRSTRGSGQLKTGLGPRDIRLLVIKWAGEKVFRLAFITPPKMTQKLGKAFRRTTYSFGRLSWVEAEDIHPLKVRLTKVRAGDSVKSLSKHMPFTRLSTNGFGC
jgi:predicted Zn-dependent protease